MPAVIQIFKAVATIKKPDYTTSARQAVGEWKSFSSTTGYLAHGTLVLPAASENDLSLKNPDLIVIQDIKGYNAFLIDKLQKESQLPSWWSLNVAKRIHANNPQLKAFTVLSKPWKFELFEFRKVDDDSFEVWFNYNNDIGIPKRQSHQIAILKDGQSLRYKVNGRSDFTFSGRKQRTFAEYDFTISFLGIADAIQFKEMNKMVIAKMPQTCGKLVDERKMLS